MLSSTHPFQLSLLNRSLCSIWRMSMVILTSTSSKSPLCLSQAIQQFLNFIHKVPHILSDPSQMVDGVATPISPTLMASTWKSSLISPLEPIPSIFPTLWEDNGNRSSLLRTLNWLQVHGTLPTGVVVAMPNLSWSMAKAARTWPTTERTSSVNN